MKINLPRRNLIFSALGATSVSELLAQNNADSKEKSQHPFRVVNVNEDGRRVLVFFDFSCPFCAQYHASLYGWSQTVPKSVETLFIPVVNTADKPRIAQQVYAARCYYSAFALASKNQMSIFLTSVYEGLQGGSLSVIDSKLWIDAARKSKIDLRKFVDGVSSNKYEAQIRNSGWKTLQYTLKATPSVAVGGRYVITPEDTAGDIKMFFNILNGLASEII